MTAPAVPIDLGVDTPVYFSLYGTVFRGASSNVGVTIGTTQIEITSAICAILRKNQVAGGRHG